MGYSAVILLGFLVAAAAVGLALCAIEILRRGLPESHPWQGRLQKGVGSRLSRAIFERVEIIGFVVAIALGIVITILYS